MNQQPFNMMEFPIIMVTEKTQQPSTPDSQKANQFKFQELRRFLHIFLQLRNWIMEQTRMWWRFSKPGFLHHQSSNNDGGFTHFPPTYQLNHGTSTWKSWLWKYEKNFSLRKSGQSTPIRTSMVPSRKTKQPRKRFHQLHPRYLQISPQR